VGIIKKTKKKDILPVTFDIPDNLNNAAESQFSGFSISPKSQTNLRKQNSKKTFIYSIFQLK